jgi:hypothetical protein
LEKDPGGPLKGENPGVWHNSGFQDDAAGRTTPYVLAVRTLLKGLNIRGAYLCKKESVIIIDDILVSDEIVEKQFVCDLAKCKGGCCEDGDAGAPLEKEELDIILQVYEKIKPYLTPAAIKQIERQGKYHYDREFGWVTPTLSSDREICVYGRRDEKGVIQCAFEQAYYAGIIEWKKPVSCHLFPIIAHKPKKDQYQRLNYEAREKLCDPACGLGAKLQVPTYEFLKESLIRKFGEEFYTTLDKIAKEYYAEKQESLK